MEWRIRASSHGGFEAELGLPVGAGERIPGIIGATMPAFIVYESHHFDSERQAMRYIERRRCA